MEEEEDGWMGIHHNRDSLMKGGNVTHRLSYIALRPSAKKGETLFT